MHEEVIRRFHELYYDAARRGGTWYNTFWMGTPTQKCPLDLWIYQEILREIRPALIIEAGTCQGGSALFLAHLCELLGAGHVLTIDIVDQARVSHPRLTRLIGSSTENRVVEEIYLRARGKEPVLVILDSDHRASHVLQELRLYSPLVTPGSYLIVEDTNVNGHPVFVNFGPGPREAVEAFLREDAQFIPDRSREKFLLTFNPFGYLRRSKEAAPARQGGAGAASAPLPMNGVRVSDQECSGASPGSGPTAPPLREDRPPPARNLRQAFDPPPAPSAVGTCGESLLKTVSVITPWRDHPELIPDYERAVVGGKVIVIDNGSDPGPASAIRDMVRRLGGIYVRNEGNRGFAAANNQGLARAQGDVVLFLNNDIRAEPDFLNAVCFDVADGELVGPSLLQVIVYGMRLPYLEGWCLAGRRDAFARLGGWDAAAYPEPYWEDADLCLRALKTGVSLRRAAWPVNHKLGQTTGPLVHWGEAYERNRATFAQRVRPFYEEIRAARGQEQPSTLAAATAEPVQGKPLSYPALHTENPLHMPKDPDYNRRCRDEVIHLLVQRGIHASRVLELGCSGGETSQKLKQVLKSDYYVGIERCAEASARARQCLDRVYQADLDRSLPADMGLGEEAFDLLVGLDVLENLYDPWEVLARFSRCLKPGGHAVFSLPNIQNINVLSELAEGKWSYKGSGLLDAGHLRFFTFDGVQELLRGAGLSLVAARGTLEPNAVVEHLPETGNTVTRGRFTITPLSREETGRLFTFQYLIIAQRSFDPAPANVG